MTLDSELYYAMKRSSCCVEPVRRTSATSFERRRNPGSLVLDYGSTTEPILMRLQKCLARPKYNDRSCRAAATWYDWPILLAFALMQYGARRQHRRSPIGRHSRSTPWTR